MAQWLTETRWAVITYAVVIVVASLAIFLYF